MAHVHRIGLIADTHGLLRPAVAARFAGVERILHAGDVGSPGVLIGLGAIAPVEAVWGNVDDRAMPGLVERVHLEVGGCRVVVTHGHELGSPTPTRLVERYDADVIVYGHTHRALIQRIGAQLVVNPGAAGAARFHLVPSVCVLTVTDGNAEVELLPLV